MIRIRYLKVMETTTVTVIKRFRLPGGEWVTVSEDIEVPASYSDQGFTWEKMDSEGLLIHYTMRQEDTPDGEEAVPKVISPWAQLLPDDTILPGWVDKDNVIKINNWLEDP